jgi:predicted RNA-binding protein with PIN domain/cytochrome c-type biogenesis protein CcmH/NrfG
VTQACIFHSKPYGRLMLSDWLIIDGNNLVHQMPRRAGLPFAAARTDLARQIDEVGGVLAKRVILVFDGTRGGEDEVFRASSVEVLFSPGNRTADDMIERMVATEADKHDIVVVTSDRAERDTVLAVGGGVMSCAHFLDELAVQRGAMVRTMRAKPGGRSTGPSLGDFFPDVMQVLLLVACFGLTLQPGRAWAHGSVHERIDVVNVELMEDPQNGELLVRRATLNLEHGDADKALADLDAASRMEAPRVDIPVLRARALAVLDRRSEALKVLAGYLALHPGSVGAYLTRAGLQEDATHYKDAALDYERAVKHADPPKADYYLGWARCLSLSGETDAAYGVLCQGVQRLPVVTVLAVAAYKKAVETGRYEEALRAIERFLKRTRRQERWLAEKGDVLRKQGKPDAAKEAYRAALVAMGELPQRHRNVIAVRRLEERVRKGLSELSAASAAH